MITAHGIQEAARRIRPYIHHTPLLTSSYLNNLSGAEVFFKCENFQKTGSFKARGATNAVLKLSATEKAKGVTTHSSGNHGQALAWAAAQLGIRAWIVMPSSAPQVKKEAVKSYGAEVVECEPTLEARETMLAKVQNDTGAVFIPPYNFYDTIEGQATAALEIFTEKGDIDFLLAPVGGGGLLSGSGFSTAYFSPATKVIGCEPEMADDARESFASGKLVAARNAPTIADGLKTSLGDITFACIKTYISDILLCSEEEIKSAMTMVWQRMKIIIEPSSAVAVACLLKNKDRYRGKRIALILSGGNVDFNHLPL